MLRSLSSRPASHCVLSYSSRVTLSTLPYPKSSETQAAPDGTPINYPTGQPPVHEQTLPPVPPNDLLDAKWTPRTPTAAGTNPATMGIPPQPKVSNTLVLPGEPVTAAPPPLASERPQQPSNEQYERIPSSRFSAFLRSIRSNLPFFPAKKNNASAMNITTTREHFIPVRRGRAERLIRSFPTV